MSDWADFCESCGIDPNDPEQFDNLLDSFSKEEEEKPVLIHKKTGVKYTFNSLADKDCARCNGTGYIGRYKWNCNGRCFKCISDSIWNQLKIEN